MKGCVIMIRNMSCFLLFIFIIISLLGCAAKDNEVIYRGESQNWRATYTISTSPKGENYDVNWQLIYVGQTIPKNNVITYEIISEHSNIKADVKLIGDRTEGKSSTYFYDENEIIQFIITIDGEEERVVLQH